MSRTVEIRGQVLTLSPDQDAAVDAILAFLALPENSVAVLAGCAGSGKTTVQKAILAAWTGNVIFLAPTGKAAIRLAEQTGRQARTIHSAIFGNVEEGESRGRRENLQFGELRPPDGCGPSTLVVVDEGSMVSVELADFLITAVLSVRGHILVVGDHEQLPPVEGRWGFDLQNPTARLTTVHRQALESDTLLLATLVREGRGQEFTKWGEDVNRIHPATVETAVDWAEECRALEKLTSFMTKDEAAEVIPSRILLTWTNKVRKAANRITREKRGYPRKEVRVGETLICRYNHHDLGIMNGETFDVVQVEVCQPLSDAIKDTVIWVTAERPTPQEPERTQCFLMVPSTFDAYHPNKSDRKIYREAWKLLWAPDRAHEEGQETSGGLCHRLGWSLTDLAKWRNQMQKSAIQGTWGYALTVHSSQGSEWDEVGFISCPGYRKPASEGGRLTPDDKRRLTYTAITRAAERFTAFVVTALPDFRRRDPYTRSQR